MTPYYETRQPFSSGCKHFIVYLLNGTERKTIYFFRTIKILRQFKHHLHFGPLYFVTIQCQWDDIYLFLELVGFYYAA